ncbi:hypothetical protein L207DRAFT_210953 [Hyaloscypha variabilis F]|uniref:Uncharacterized protein n=1 Tax=Hyaloscypha variabilis (strain UAMH 11265 / GT02V1 / F) TaxID=1149755 RepID=A0A2J6S6E5_HYAVF|nr:hypothetical protein L207DRAFT_210953 [Hyaloscypha variabilis F]
MPEPSSPNVHTEPSRTLEDGSQPPLGITAYSMNTQGALYETGQTAVLTLPPALPPQGPQQINSYKGITGSPEIRTISRSPLTMQSNGIHGASTLRMHARPGLWPIGLSHPDVLPSNSPYVNSRHWYPGSVLPPQSVPIYQHSGQNGEALHTLSSHCGYRSGFSPAFRAPQIAPIANTTSYISSLPHSQRYDMASNHLQPAANSLDNPGSANLAAIDQPPSQASLAKDAAAESTPLSSPAPASMSESSISQILGERALNDPDLEALMEIVQSEKPTSEAMKKFQALIDELAQKPKLHPEKQSLQPSRPLPSVVVPAPVKGHETARSAPASTPGPTPISAEATPALSSPTARFEPQSQPQCAALRSKAPSRGVIADTDPPGAVFPPESQRQAGVSGEKEVHKASGGWQPVVSLPLDQRVALTSANKSNEEQSKNLTEQHQGNMRASVETTNHGCEFGYFTSA